MKKNRLPLLASVLTLASSPLLAQDVVSANPAACRVKLDNDKVRVVEVTLKPGESQPLHTHPANFAYVLTNGSLKVAYAGGPTETATARKGDVIWSDPEGPHVSTNVGKTTLHYVLVELKTVPWVPPAK